MCVFVGSSILLTELRLRENLIVINFSDLKSRCRIGLARFLQVLRGLACQQLVSLDRFDSQSVEAIADRLSVESVCVRTNSATALAMFGNLAFDVQPAFSAARRNAVQTLVDAAEKPLQIIDTAKVVNNANILGCRR